MNRPNIKNITGLLTASLLLAGCTMIGPDYKAPEIDTPAALTSSDDGPASNLLSQDQTEDWVMWWQIFEDAELNDLIQNAQADNLNIRLQADRIREARARLGFSRADRLPNLGFEGEAGRQDQSNASLPVTGTTSGPINNFSLAAVLSYELDLWGRLARQEEAAKALLAQSVFSHHAIQLNTIADVATTYFNIRTAQKQLAITRQTLDALQGAYDIENIRYQEGDSDPLTVKQLEAELEITRANLPILKAQLATLKNALGILTGQSPAQLFEPQDLGEKFLERDLTMPQHLPDMLPSDLLLRRPDIRAAEAELIAETAQISIAMADRLPRLNLNTLIGTAARDIDDLFTSPARNWGIGASVLGPILDGGRSRANIETAEARRDQAETRYRITAQTAFSEIRDALIAYESARERQVITARQVETLQDMLDLVNTRYQEGLVSYIEVLDAQRNLFSAELLQAEADRDQFTAIVTLFKALGGGWQEQPI